MDFGMILGTMNRVTTKEVIRGDRSRDAGEVWIFDMNSGCFTYHISPQIVAGIHFQEVEDMDDSGMKTLIRDRIMYAVGLQEGDE